jgi:enoyl-CoA hydratase
VSIVDTHFENGVATLTLNDPDRRNALSPEMVSAISSAFDYYEREVECAAVVVTGAGTAFCSGADLSHLTGATQSGLREIYEGFLRVAHSTIPTIAAVNGAAVGAGMNLALACDVRVIGASTRFVKLGIHPGGGHTWMLRNLVGPQTAHAMVVFGQVIGADDAVRLGLAWSSVADDELLATAQALAARAATAPVELVQRVKQTINEMIEIDDHDDAVDHELVAQVWSMTNPEFQQRVVALREEIHHEAPDPAPASPAPHVPPGANPGWIYPAAEGADAGAPDRQASTPQRFPQQNQDPIGTDQDRQQQQ